MWKVLSLITFNSFLLFATTEAGTSISVENNYKKEINVKIAGSGVGGCDILLQPGESNQNDCWCLWGTVNYGFCSYEQGIGGLNQTETDEKGGLTTGKCKVVTGESLLCSDVSSLGNCYDGAYSCVIDESGFCHCETV